jgi:hypothetical protein
MSSREADEINNNTRSSLAAGMYEADMLEERARELKPAA